MYVAQNVVTPCTFRVHTYKNDWKRRCLMFSLIWKNSKLFPYIWCSSVAFFEPWEPIFDYGFVEFRDNRGKFSFPGGTRDRRSKSGTVLGVSERLAPMALAKMDRLISCVGRFFLVCALVGTNINANGKIAIINLYEFWRQIQMVSLIAFCIGRDSGASKQIPYALC